MGARHVTLPWDHNAPFVYDDHNDNEGDHNEIKDDDDDDNEYDDDDEGKDNEDDDCSGDDESNYGGVGCSAILTSLV